MIGVRIGSGHKSRTNPRYSHPNPNGLLPRRRHRICRAWHHEQHGTFSPSYPYSSVTPPNLTETNLSPFRHSNRTLSSRPSFL